MKSSSRQNKKKFELALIIIIIITIMYHCASLDSRVTLRHGHSRMMYKKHQNKKINALVIVIYITIIIVIELKLRLMRECEEHLKEHF